MFENSCTFANSLVYFFSVFYYVAAVHFEGVNMSGAKVSLSKANAVCLDVDSTVIAEEGIDVLANFLGAGNAVAELTAGK